MARKKAIERAVLKAGFDALAYSKRICPVDTGRLKNSLRMEFKEGMFILKTPLAYASFVEYGTPSMIKAHGRHDPKSPVKEWSASKKRGATGQMMPFVRPALHQFLNVFLPRRLRLELAKSRGGS